VLPWPFVGVNWTPRLTCPQKRRGSGSEHWDSDSVVGYNSIILIRIRHYRKVPGYIETGHENRMNVICRLPATGELYP